MRRRATRARLLGAVPAVLVVLVMAAGCGGPAGPVAGRPVVVTQVPVGTPAGGLEPGERYPDGSRLVLLDLDRPGAAPRVLTEGMAAAGGVGLSHDGRRLVFVGKGGAGDLFSVWSAAPDGSDRHQVAAPGADCGAAAFLPDGRIVFSARVPGPPPGAPLTSAWALFVVAAEGPEEERRPQRITFGGGELDPAVLADGRIVHARLQPGGDGRPAGGSLSLFTVHPDGTGAAPLHGHHGGPRRKLLPRQAPGGDVFFLAAGPDAPAVIRAAGWRSPAREGSAVTLAAGDASSGAAGVEPLSVEPAAGGRLLVAAAGAGGGLLLTDRDGRVLERMPAGNPAWQVAQAVAVASRPRPQGHLSMIDPAGEKGYLLCLDARPPGAPEAARVRLRTAAGEGGAVLGEVPLAEDGSFFAAVPADVPLLLDLLDARGRTLVRTVTPVWVRPKEVRGCIGCHEDPETAPPNRRPLAVLGEPVDLTGGAPPGTGGSDPGPPPAPAASPEVAG